MLRTDDLPLMPEGVEVIADYGHEVVISDGRIVAEGDVIYICGNEAVIRGWLGGREIWVGNGLVGFKLLRVSKLGSITDDIEG